MDDGTYDNGMILLLRSRYPRRANTLISRPKSRSAVILRCRRDLISGQACVSTRHDDRHGQSSVPWSHRLGFNHSYSVTAWPEEWAQSLGIGIVFDSNCICFSPCKSGRCHHGLSCQRLHEALEFVQRQIPKSFSTQKQHSYAAPTDQSTACRKIKGYYTKHLS